MEINDYLGRTSLPNIKGRILERVSIKDLRIALEEYSNADMKWKRYSKMNDLSAKADAGDHLFWIVRAMLINIANAVTDSEGNYHLPILNEPYKEKSRRKFNDTEKNQVKSAVVVDGEFGPSACFFMKSGGQVYMKMSPNSKLSVGEIINMDEAEIVTSGRAGSTDIDEIE